MNNEKAREYFSAHAEGTLDAGLAQSFEAKLKADAELQAEYDQFKATLEELNSLRFEKIEVPFDLNERISAAVDRSIYEKKRASSPSWTMWLRNLAFTGLAAAAIFGAYYTLNLNNSDNTQTASIGGVPRIERIEYGKDSQGVQMKYRPSDKHSVIIKGGRDGDQAFEVSKNGWENVLRNDQPNAAVFTVEVTGETPATTVVVPGTKRSPSKLKQGSILDLAKAIADHYGVPVIVKTANLTDNLSWSFGTANAQQEVAQALNGMPYGADLGENGVLTISDN